MKRQERKTRGIVGTEKSIRQMKKKSGRENPTPGSRSVKKDTRGPPYYPRSTETEMAVDRSKRVGQNNKSLNEFH